MKTILKEFFGNAFLSAIYGAAFYAVMSVLGEGESRTGRYAGVEPHWLIIGTFALGLWSVRWMKRVPKEKWTIGVVRALAFLAVGAWFYTQATGMQDLTIDSGAYPIPFQEGVAIVYGAGIIGFLIGWAYTGINKLVCRKPSNQYA